MEAAISANGGVILFTTLGTYHVRFPVRDPDALDQIKADLTAAGFDVRYSLVLKVP